MHAQQALSKCSTRCIYGCRPSTPARGSCIGICMIATRIRTRTSKYCHQARLQTHPGTNAPKRNAQERFENSQKSEPSQRWKETPAGPLPPKAHEDRANGTLKAIQGQRKPQRTSPSEQNDVGTQGQEQFQLKSRTGGQDKGQRSLNDPQDARDGPTCPT